MSFETGWGGLGTTGTGLPGLLGRPPVGGLGGGRGGGGIGTAFGLAMVLGAVTFIAGETIATFVSGS